MVKLTSYDFIKIQYDFLIDYISGQENIVLISYMRLKQRKAGQQSNTQNPTRVDVFQNLPKLSAKSTN